MVKFLVLKSGTGGALEKKRSMNEWIKGGGLKQKNRRINEPGAVYFKLLYER